ncbi:PTS sugar transporter subunit IIA [Suttonella sp. R2A3]|uniref:PTS galactosamine/N-acetylgalactosamine transporter subunit IIA n=1 Tax=Suttonella sp. R2A3 TaxID=2908648 RepID=UPI001F344F19|nr:PTS galactosamine/N-acetylgalactosamine transporter subunit IIA [Suttonella sp. R2A3]UJF24055.1 PTS sugar transporter subunit IIA [Suttonella sp. R2A3]
MIQLIVTGHGEFAEGLSSAAQLLCGELSDCQVINFSEGMSGDDFSAALNKAVESLGESPVLCLTDILGGTPFRECAKIAMAREDCEVISGANVQMLVEATMEREDEADVHTLATMLVESAREGLTTLSEQSQQKKSHTSDDGI